MGSPLDFFKEGIDIPGNRDTFGTALVTMTMA